MKNQEYSHKRHKHATYFDKSTKYYPKIVLSILDQNPSIVTAYVMNKNKSRLEV